MKKCLLTITLMLTAIGSNAQNTYFINPDATGTGDGSSWTNGFTDFTDMFMSGNFVVDYSNPAADTILVKMGTHFIDNVILSAENGKELRVYGGFQGTEQYSTQRNPELYPTIFSGDLNGDDDPNNTATWAENNSNLLELRTADEGHIYVEGFTFTGAFNQLDNGGNGSALWIGTAEGGTFGEPIPGKGTFTIRNCIFNRNFAGGLGGAVYIKPLTDVAASSGAYCDVTIDKCQFIENGSGSRGSAIMCFAENAFDNGSLTLNVLNSLFKGNVDLSASFPAVVYAGASSSNSIVQCRVLNNTFIENVGMAAYAWTNQLLNNSMKLTFMNNMVLPQFSGDQTVSVGLSGDNNPDGYEYNVYNNFALDGAFTSAVNPSMSNIINNVTSFVPLAEMPDGLSGNYQLGSSATAIDYGSISGLETLFDGEDLLGNPRISGDNIDIGAYEFQQGTSSIETLEASLMLCYPNPAQEMVKIGLTSPESIVVMNAQGAIVFVSEKQPVHFVDIRSWESGLYMVRTASGQVTRFVKQ